MSDYRVFSVAYGVLNNNKRMAKLKGIQKRFDRYDKARNFVIAECQAQGERLNKDEIANATHEVLQRIK